MSTTTCLIGMPPERPPDPASALAAESHGIARPATPSAPAPLSTSRRPIRWSKIDGLLPPIFPPGTNPSARLPSKTPVGCHANHVPLRPGADGAERPANSAPARQDRVAGVGLGVVRGGRLGRHVEPQQRRVELAASLDVCHGQPHVVDFAQTDLLSHLVPLCATSCTCRFVPIIEG